MPAGMRTIGRLVALRRRLSPGVPGPSGYGRATVCVLGEKRDVHLRSVGAGRLSDEADSESGSERREAAARSCAT